MTKGEIIGVSVHKRILKEAVAKAKKQAVGEVWEHLWNTCTPKVFKGVDYVSWAEVSKELKSLSKRYGLTGKGGGLKEEGGKIGK